MDSRPPRAPTSLVPANADTLTLHFLIIRRDSQPSCKPIPSPSPLSPSRFTQLQTGNSAFLLPPLILSSAICIYGPTTGTFPAKLPIVAKKSPNSTNIPYNSTKKPVNGHRSKIKRMPATNAAVPLSFCRRAKKTSVFRMPIMSVRPIMKRICKRGRE